MAGTPPGIPPDTLDVMDMSWEHTGLPINTTLPSQPVQNINNTLVTGNGHPILQSEERVDNDAANARNVTYYNPRERLLLQPRGRLNRNAAITRNVIPLNNAARSALDIRASHRHGRTLLQPRGRDSTNVATTRILPSAVTTNPQPRPIQNTNSLLRAQNRGVRYPGFSPLGYRPSINERINRNVTDDARYIHALYQTSYQPRERTRLNLNAPSFRILADDSVHTSPLLQSIQRESLARSQSPRQDPVVPQLKRRLNDEATSAGGSEDKYFQGESYFSTIGAVQTTVEGKRRLISLNDEGKTNISPRKSPTNRSSSSIFFQDLTRAPGHRPVTPVTPPKFRGNGRSMPGAWPESPVTPLTLDTSTNLVTPPPTPDMSTMPGAWPKSPEPLPFTTMGTAAITPPESPVDGSPSATMEDSPGGIPESSAIEHSDGAALACPDVPERNRGPAVWPEGPEEYQHRHLDTWTQNAVVVLEEMGNTNWYRRNMSRPPPTQNTDSYRQNMRRLPPTQRVSFPENPVTRVKKYAKGETISYPSPASTISSQDETSLLSLSPSAQLCRELVETVSSPSPPSSPSSNDGSPSPSLDPSTPTKDDHTDPTDPASAQLAQEFENFLLRSDRHKVYRDVEQEEAEKTRHAQAVEQARQAEAEEARKKAEDEARRKIEEDESCKKNGRRRLPAKSVLEPLTAEWETKLRDILGKRANEVVARTSAGNELDRRDIGKVLPQPGTADDPSGWLNDNVINGYLDSTVDHGLQARGHRRGETPKLHAFNSAFYKNITERGVESVKRWSRRPKISGKDLLKVEHVFIPVNVGGAHWTLLVVSPVWKRIEYFDSLHGSSVAAIRNAKAWIKMELGEAWNEHEWEVVEDPALAGRGKGPRQSNSSDCGVFTITTAKMISLGVDPMAITASDMPLQRKRVVVELVNGGFHGDFEPHVVF